MPPTITIHKLDHQGNHVIAYEGSLVDRGETWICIRAVFAYKDVPIGDITLCKGDVMTEWFYADRYYNVFRIESGEANHLKGWYCNITRPAQITESEVFADDLALDVLVYADHTIEILDQDDFDALRLGEEETAAANAAVQQIQQLAVSQLAPFDQ